MKFKASKKEMKENFNNIISVGYCDLQTLLKYENPIAYSAGVYGWACDYYDLKGVLISTGYSPIGRHIDHNRIREYEHKAQEVCSLGYEQSKEGLNALIKEFAKEFSA